MIEILFAMRLAPDAEDVGGAVGVEADEVAAASPEIALVAEEIVDLVGLVVEPAELVDRDVDVGVLEMKWVERDDDEDDVIPRRGHFRIIEDEVVVRALEAQIAQLLERAVI